MSRKGKIDLLNKTEFKDVVNKSKSIRELLNNIGYKNTSGAMHKKAKERIINEGLNIDHMVSRFGNSNGNKISLSEILIKDSTYQNMGRLKIRLVREGYLDYKCLKCENEGEWMGEEITLQLDHINGINNDNRIENLRFLCPNCHSQTKTYGSKNIGNYD